jgi:hypothetical protein
LNRDGIPDEIELGGAGAGQPAPVLIRLGLGKLQFSAVRAFPAGRQLSETTVADVTGDGIPDIITANAGSSDLSVLAGAGDATFLAPVSIPLAAGSSPEHVAAGDVNGDGIPDLIATQHSVPTVAIALGAGKGVFHPAQNVRAVPAGVVPLQLALGDLDGDGIDDIVTTFGETGVAILFGSKQASFAEPRVLSNTLTVGASLTVADLNGDGNADILDSKQVFIGTGGGSFQDPINTGSGVLIGARDMNGDGRIDLVYRLTGQPSTVRVFLQQ